MHDRQKKNPLRNERAMERLCPGSMKRTVARRKEVMKSTQRNAGWKSKGNGQSKRNTNKAGRTARRNASRTWMKNVRTQ